VQQYAAKGGGSLYAIDHLALEKLVIALLAAAGAGTTLPQVEGSLGSSAVGKKLQRIVRRGSGQGLPEALAKTQQAAQTEPAPEVIRTHRMAIGVNGRVYI
jgi:hypothetical protein